MRGEEYGYDADDGAHYYKNVVVTVYAPNGKFTIEGSKNGAGVDQVEFTEPEPEPAEEESESTK